MQIFQNYYVSSVSRIFIDLGLKFLTKCMPTLLNLKGITKRSRNVKEITIAVILLILNFKG